ncbi:MAG: hypothetical protein AAB546_04480 [Patescibacteria group bacterium]
MSKTNIIVLVLIVFLLVAGGVGLYLTLKPKDTKNSQASSDFYNGTTILPTPNTNELIYKDSSGFSFKYKSGYSVKDVTPDDADTYSVVSIAKGNEVLTLSIKDTKYKTLMDWEKDNKTASMVGAVNLSGMSAKQYLLAGNTLTVAIDQGVIYVVTGKESESYTLLVNTFVFADPNEKSTASDLTSDIIYEEEEVVE